MCALEFPDIEANIHQRFAGRGVVVVGVHPGGLSGGDDAERLALFREQTGATFPLAWDRSSSYRSYSEGAGISPFPLDVVIDAGGVVRHVSREFNLDELVAAIEPLLPEDPP